MERDADEFTEVTDADELTDTRVGELVERDFHLELDAVDALADLSRKVMLKWKTTGLRHRADRIIAAEFTRSSTSFQAVVRLARAGFGRQGLMINRSMFEGMAAAHWVAANRDEAEERFEHAGAYMIHLSRAEILRLVEDHPDLPGELSETEVRAAAKEFGRYGERPWTGHRGIRDLVEAVEDQWSDEAREGLRDYLNVEHDHNNQHLHGTAHALLGSFVDPSAVRGGVPGVSLRIGPGPQDIENALMGAFFSYSNLLSLMIGHFELGEGLAQDLRRITAYHHYAFVPVSEADAVGRNDPCPCGSGRKFKKCHQGHLDAAR